MNKYVAWKLNEKGIQIGKDRIFNADSIKNVFSVLAVEENVKYKNERVLLRLPNNCTWHVKILHINKI